METAYEMTAFHCHSMYSHNSTVQPEKLVKMALEKGIRNVVLTDHNSTLGINEFMDAGEKYGVNTIPGVQLAVPEHVLVTARNSEGYHAILNAVAEVVRTDCPSEDIIKHHFMANDNVIVTTACLSGAIASILSFNAGNQKKKQYLEEQINSLKEAQVLFDETQAEIAELNEKIAEENRIVKDFSGYTKQPYQDKIDTLKGNFQLSITQTITPESMEKKRDYAINAVNTAQKNLEQLKARLKQAQENKRSAGYLLKQYNTFQQELKVLPYVDEEKLYEKAKKKLLEYKAYFPHLYVELPGRPEESGLVPVLLRLAKDCNVGFIASQNTHTLTAEDKKSLSMRYKSAGIDVEAANETGLQSYEELLKNLEQVIGTEDAHKAVHNLSVFSSCRVRLQSLETEAADDVMAAIFRLAQLYGTVPRQELKFMPVQHERAEEWIKEKGFPCGAGAEPYTGKNRIAIASRIFPYIMQSLKSIYGERRVCASVKRLFFTRKEALMLAAPASFPILLELINAEKENRIEEYLSLLDDEQREQAEQIYRDALLLDGIVKCTVADENRIIITRKDTADAWDSRNKLWMCDFYNEAVEIMGSRELDIVTECLHLIYRHRGMIVEIPYEDNVFRSFKETSGCTVGKEEACSKTGYKMMYLSMHFPIEYTCATLNHSGDLALAERELLLPPDINCSFYDHTISGDKIQCGFCCIKGITEDAVVPIIDERSGYQTEKPYSSFFDFLMRNSVDTAGILKLPPREVVSGLILAGAFDNLHPNRDALLTVYEQAVKLSSEKRRFSVTDIKLTHAKPDERKKRCYDLMYMGQVMGKIPCFDNVSEWDYACQSPNHIRKAGKGFVMGIVINTESRKTAQYRDMLALTLHTKQETIEVLLFDKLAREDFMGEVLKIAVSYHNDTFFGNSAERLVQPLRRFFVDIATPDELNRLADIVRGTAGNNLLYIRSSYHKGERLRIPRMYEPIQVSDGVVNKLKAVLLDYE